MTSVYNYTSKGGSHPNPIQEVCLQLRSLQCFLNFTAEDGVILLRKKVKKLQKPIYLFRLSATVPGVITLQYILPVGTRPQVYNVRIGSQTMKDYNFFMSPRKYSEVCEAFIGLQTPSFSSGDMVHMKPSLKEMVGLTDSYVQYFDTRDRVTSIMLKGDGKYVY